MRRSILLAATLLAAAMLGLGIAATVELLDTRSLLAGQLSRISGYDVAIDGPIRLRPGLLPGLRLRRVQVAGATGDSVLRSARADRLDLVFALWPLLRGELELHRIGVSKVSVVLEEGSGEVPGSLGRGGPIALALDAVEIEQLEIEWRWADGGESLVGQLERLELGWGGAHIEGEVVGALERVPFDLSGRYDPTPQDAAPILSIRGRIAGADVALEGKTVVGKGIELAFRFDAPHLRALGSGAGREWPALGPILAQGRLALSRWKVGLSDLDLHVGDAESAWLGLTGFLDDVRGRRGYSLKAQFGVADVRSLQPWVRDPPDIGPVRGTLVLDDNAGVHRIEELTLKGGRPGVFEVDAECHFRDVSSVDGLVARLRVEARDLAVLGELLHVDAPPIAPVSLSGRVTAEKGYLVGKGVQAQLGRNRFTGSLRGRVAAEHRPSLLASLEIPVLYLEDVGLSPGARAAPEPPAAPAGWLSTDPLPWERLLDLDARLQGRADEVVGVDGPLLDSARFEAGLTEGRLTVAPLDFSWQQGSIEASLTLDAVSSPPGLSLRATANGMRLERLMAPFDPRGAWSGDLDVHLDLRSRGRSAHELAAGLTGSASAICRGGTIDVAHAGLLTRDLFGTLRGRAAKPASERLNCFVADLEIEQGVVRPKALLLDAADVVLVGKGRVDLAGNAWDLRIAPHPRDPRLLSTAAKVSITGPLAGLRIRAAPGSLVTSATGALAHNVGRYSGLRGLWRKLTRRGAEADPCAGVLDAAP